MLITDASGGSAASVESNNKANTDINQADAKRCIDHLGATLPIVPGGATPHFPALRSSPRLLQAGRSGPKAVSGASCLRRMDESAEIIVLERGLYASFANCGLPYEIGGVIEKEGDLLAAKGPFFKERIDVITMAIR